MLVCRVDDELELRLLEERHADELYALVDANRTYLREWLPWVDATSSVAETRTFIKSGLQLFADNGAFNSGTWYRGHLVGTIGLHQIDWAGATEIGYWLSESTQGNGIMTRGCRGLIDYAFHELGLNRVQIRCAPANRKSRAIPERLGFAEEGTVRQGERLGDRLVDLVIYGMLAEDWR